MYINNIIIGLDIKVYDVLSFAVKWVNSHVMQKKKVIPVSNKIIFLIYDSLHLLSYLTGKTANERLTEIEK